MSIDFNVVDPRKYALTLDCIEISSKFTNKLIWIFNLYLFHSHLVNFEIFHNGLYIVEYIVFR